LRQPAPMNDVAGESAPDRSVGPLDVQSVALTIVFGAGAVYAARAGVAVIAPILVSVLLAYAIEPLVRLICRTRLPRPFAVLVAYALLIAALATTAAIARRQFLAFVDVLPVAVHDLQRSIERARHAGRAGESAEAMQHLQDAARDISGTFSAGAPRRAGVTRVTDATPRFDVRTYVGDMSVAIGIGSLQFIAIAVLTLFLLLGGEALKRKLIAIAGARARKKVTHDVIKAIDRQIERYLVARLLISGIVAGATWVGLWCLGVREPLVLGLTAGVLNIVPFIGPATAVALIALVAFLQFHDLEPTAAAVVVAGTIAALEGNLISPWLTSRAGELNTVAVFISVLFWGWMWDVWGLVLAIPIMVAVKAAADHIEPLQPLGEFLGR
jgi:predicted PurR-regulated permease PerM